MPQTVGANVARAARLADAFAVADSNAKSTGKLSATAKWHEQQSIRTLSKSLQRQRDKESMEQEHKCATKEMLSRRSQRMKELYEAEFAQLTRELEDMGLTISISKS